jgi:predicted N-acetyltransferase YhbS
LPQGFAMLSLPSGSMNADLVYLVVNPENLLPKLKTRGIGSLLLREVEAAAEHRAISVTSYSNVVSFYKKNGYKVVAGEHGSMIVDMVKE